LHADDGLFEFVVAPLQAHLHKVAEKPGKLFTPREQGACEYPLELPANHLGLRFRNQHRYEHTFCFHRGAMGVHTPGTPIGSCRSVLRTSMVGVCDSLDCSRSRPAVPRWRLKGLPALYFTSNS